MINAVWKNQHSIINAHPKGKYFQLKLSTLNQAKEFTWHVK